MNVVFVEPAFPPTQRHFVRALAEVGVTDEQQMQKIAANTLSDVLAGKKNLPDLQGLREILEVAK